MNLDDIAEHVSRITIRPHTHRQADGRTSTEWVFEIDLRFDPPHHTVTGYGPTLEHALQMALDRVGVHIAMGKLSS